MAGQPEKPHYHGHRARLRNRFLLGGAGALQDYELLELLLTFAIPYSDVKPLAKSLIAHFGSFTRVFDKEPEKPHYYGHRARLRQRFLLGGAGALQDYELLELLLTFAIPYSDVKPLAKSLIAHFGSFTRVFDATPEALAEVPGIREYSAVLIRLVKACAEYYLKEGVLDRQKISSLSTLVDYCRTSMGGLADEQFRVHLPQQPERNHRRRRSSRRAPSTRRWSTPARSWNWP